jgi:hypothetical protein
MNRQLFVRFVKEELKRTLNKSIVAYFMALSRNLYGQTEENHEEQQNIWSQGRD